MNVNYYFDRPYNEDGHIGGSSGDSFVGKIPDGVNTFDEWVTWLRDETAKGRRIYAEHGLERTADDIIAMATQRGRFVSYRRPADRSKGEFEAYGHRFVRHAFH